MCINRNLLDCKIQCLRSYWKPGTPERGQHPNGRPPLWVVIRTDNKIDSVWRCKDCDQKTVRQLLTDTVACRDDVLELMGIIDAELVD